MYSIKCTAYSLYYLERLKVTEVEHLLLIMTCAFIDIIDNDVKENLLRNAAVK